MTFIGTDKRPGGGGGGGGLGPCTGVIPMTFGAALITETTAPRFLLPAGDFGSGTAPTISIGYKCQAPGNLTRFQLRIIAGGGNGLDIVYTVNLNGAPTGYAITVPSTGSGDFEIVGPALALVDGDVLDVEATKDSDVGTGPSGIQAWLRIEDSCPGCCPPAYLSQRMFDAYAEIFISGAGVFAVDLDASLCGQGRLLSVVRPSAFAGPAGTPPAVVTTMYDSVLNIVRVTLDGTAATDGRYVLEISNACRCCVLIPLEGVSV